MENWNEKGKYSTKKIVAAKAYMLKLLNQDHKEERVPYRTQYHTETVNNIKRLETQNYKIESDIPTKAKLRHGWKKSSKWGLIDGKFTDIKIIHKDLSPEETNEKEKAYAREYLETKYAGEQKFNREAVKKLWVIHSLPADFEAIEKLQNDNKDFIQLFFSQNGGTFFSGYRNTLLQKFSTIGKQELFRLGNGDAVKISHRGIEKIEPEDINHGFGCSIRRYQQDPKKLQTR